MAKAATIVKPVKRRRVESKLSQYRMFRDRLFIGFLIGAVVLFLANIAVLVLRVRPQDFVVPLQYSSLQGFDSLGQWYRVYAFGWFSLIVTAGNLVLAAIAFEKSRLASFLLVIGTLMINLFNLVIVITLISHLEL